MWANMYDANTVLTRPRLLMFVHNSGAKVTHIDGALNISAVAFSPLGTYLLTWHRRKGGDKERKWASAQ